MASGIQNISRRHTESSLQQGGDTSLCSQEITIKMTNGSTSERECTGETLGAIAQKSAVRGRLDTALCLCNGLRAFSAPSDELNFDFSGLNAVTNGEKGDE